MPNYVFNLLLVVWLGIALFHFISGDFHRSSDLKNYAVAVEILCIFGMMFFKWRRDKERHP